MKWPVNDFFLPEMASRWNRWLSQRLWQGKTCIVWKLFLWSIRQTRTSLTLSLQKWVSEGALAAFFTISLQTHFTIWDQQSETWFGVSWILTFFQERLSKQMLFTQIMGLRLTAFHRLLHLTKKWMISTGLSHSEESKIKSPWNSSRSARFESGSASGHTKKKPPCGGIGLFVDEKLS